MSWICKKVSVLFCSEFQKLIFPFQSLWVRISVFFDNILPFSKERKNSTDVDRNLIAQQQQQQQQQKMTKTKADIFCKRW